MNPVFPLLGRRALVTGGGRGLGRAIALRLAAAGAQLGLIGRDGAALAETAAAITRNPPIGIEPEWPCDWLVDWAEADVTDRSGLLRATEKLGQIDILVSNAGDAISTPFADMREADWEAMLAVNLTAAYRLFQAVLPGMKARGRGRIIAIASTAGLKGYPYAAAYCAAKHGLVGLVRALGREYAGSGVTVNAICPGFAETDLLDRSITRLASATGESEASARQRLLSHNPAGRAILPSEVAECVAYLCLDEARSITGQSLPICDGEI